MVLWREDVVLLERIWMLMVEVAMTGVNDCGTGRAQCFDGMGEVKDESLAVYAFAWPGAREEVRYH